MYLTMLIFKMNVYLPLLGKYREKNEQYTARKTEGNGNAKTR